MTTASQNQTLRQEAASSVKWLGISQVCRQGTQFATTALLANLLATSDFGLIGMALTVIGFVRIFRDLGTAAAVIQKKETDHAFLSSIFWTNVGFGLAVTILIWLTAPLVAQFYREEDLTPIVQVLSISFVISSLGTIQKSILEKNLQFAGVSKAEIISVFIGAAVGLTSALAGLGVWSIIFQTLVTEAVLSLLLWFFSSWRPARVYDWPQVRGIIKYSANLIGFKTVNYFLRNADYILIGRYLGSEALGIYTIAYMMMLYPIQNVSQIFGRFMFPLISKFQDDMPRLRQIYAKTLSYIAFITFPLMIGVMAVADLFVPVLLGSKWVAVIPVLLILAPVGMIQSIGSTVGFIYQAKGRTDWMFWWSLGAGAAVLAGFAIGLRWGIIGVASAYLLIMLVLIYPLFKIPFSIIDMKINTLWLVIRAPMLCAAVMFAAVALLRSLLHDLLPAYFELTLAVLWGVLIYVALSWWLNQKSFRDILSLTHNKFKPANV